MLEKIIMAAPSTGLLPTVERCEHYTRKARLLHKIKLCDRQLKSTQGHSRKQFELMQYAYLTQLGLIQC